MQTINQIIEERTIQDKDIFELFLWLTANSIADNVEIRNIFLTQTNIVGFLSSIIVNLIKENQVFQTCYLNEICWCLSNLTGRADGE